MSTSDQNQFATPPQRLRAAFEDEEIRRIEETPCPAELQPLTPAQEARFLRCLPQAAAPRPAPAVAAMKPVKEPPKRVRVHVLYANEDAAAARPLERHLALLVGDGLLDLRDSHLLGGGAAKAAREGIAAADVVLFLLSPQFVNQCEDVIQLARVRAKMQLTTLVPVLLKQTKLCGSWIRDLQTLPRDPHRPDVQGFRDHDEAWANIVREIRQVVRDLPARQARRLELEAPVDERRLRLLVAAATPAAASRTQAGLDLARIRARVDRLGLADRVEVIDRREVDAADLGADLLRHRPHILHFSGHGCAQDGIMLEGMGKETTTMDAGALRQMFEHLPVRPHLLVLNGCRSGAQAEALEEAVDSCIGHESHSDDRRSVEFADTLYLNLLQGRSVTQSFEQARSAVAGVPAVLRHLRGQDPVLFPPV